MTKRLYNFKGYTYSGDSFEHNIEAETSGDAIKKAPAIIADREMIEESEIDLMALCCTPIGVDKNTNVQCEGCQ